MEIKKITDTFFIASATLSVADITEIASEGFKTIICNRPNGEDLTQTPYETIETASQKNGMQFYCLPIVSGEINKHIIQEMRNILQNAPAPILAYCRSGNRCFHLWTLSQSPHAVG
jgi:uncharacterized protein (TIGR01244 family)